jgi:tetratricopeptide (TPR) repeat protein
MKFSSTIAIFFLFSWSVFSRPIQAIKLPAGSSYSEERLQYLYDQFQEYRYSNSDSAFVFADKLMNAARASEHKVWIGKAYRSKGHLLKDQGYLGDAVQAYFEAIEQFDIAHKPLHIADNLSYIGIIYMQGQDANAFTYLNKALELYEKYGTSSEQSLAHYSLGKYHWGVKNYQPALNHLHESAKLDIKSGDVEHLQMVYNLMGAVAYKQAQYEEAKEYYFKSLVLTDSITDSLRAKAIAYTNIGEVFVFQDSLEKAENWLTQTLEIGYALTEQDQFLKLSALNLLAELYKRKGEPQKALAYLEEGLKAADTKNIDHETSEALKLAINILTEEGVLESSKHYKELAKYSKMLSIQFQRLKEEKENLERLNRQYILSFAIEKHELREKIASSEEKRQKITMAIIVPIVALIALSIYLFWAMRKIAFLKNGIRKVAEMLQR